jgi:hypothetical protein
MILNVIIIVFLLAMFVVWAQYGLFSSFLHCALVIVCGAISLAIWEPLVHGFLINRMPHYAWGVALLAPLALLLIFLHVIIDRFVGVSVQFPDLYNKLGGGVFGVISGILTAGLIVLGISFLPMPSKIMGYQRYTVFGTGQVDLDNPNKLWIPVDDLAAGFYSGLSNGAFSTGTPLATHQPRLAAQAGYHRTRLDPNSSTVAHPDGVSVETMYVHGTTMEDVPGYVRDALGSAFENKANQVVVVETLWKRNADEIPGLYDPDGTLRVPPTQIKLVTAVPQAEQYTDVALTGPVAMRAKTRTSDEHPVAYFHPINSDSLSAYGFDDEERIAFAFVVPQQREPLFLMARHTRLPLPDEPTQEPGALIAALGDPAPQTEVADAGDGETSSPRNFSEGAMTGPDGVEFKVTNDLPITVSKNQVIGLNYEDNGNAVTGGEATAEGSGSRGGSRTRLNSIAAPPHRPLVRMRLTGRQAREYFGGSASSQAMTMPVFLTDDRGNTPKPMAVVWVKDNGNQYIHVKSGGSTFANGSAIGVIPRLGNDESLFLYFQVNKGASIVSYQIGQAPPQRLTPPLVAE